MACLQIGNLGLGSGNTDVLPWERARTYFKGWKHGHRESVESLKRELVAALQPSPSSGERPFDVDDLGSGLRR